VKEAEKTDQAPEGTKSEIKIVDEEKGGEQKYQSDGEKI